MISVIQVCKNDSLQSFDENLRMRDQDDLDEEHVEDNLETFHYVE